MFREPVRHVGDESDATMTQEAAVVILATAGPIIGSALGVWRKPTTAVIYNILYFAAGIMVAISFLDLIPESVHLGSTATAVAGLTMGAAAMYALDRVFPHVHDCAVCGEDECHLGRTAQFLILAIFLHNFPEGMAIGVGAATDTGDSVVIALAIAIHNIPEGICTSAPYYYASGKRLKAFLMSSASALPIVFGLPGGALPVRSHQPSGHVPSGGRHGGTDDLHRRRPVDAGGAERQQPQADHVLLHVRHRRRHAP